LADSACQTVLLTGATGTGKEVLARQFHRRRCESGPFLAVNCAALTGSLLESELFGHVRGSFTGADRDKTGLFEAAGDGVILLDEISEMPLDLQGRLLRALQERHVRRVGGLEELPFHATVVATSNRDLLAQSQQGKFRSDLYYRLAIMPIHVPALAGPQRRADVCPLAMHFLAHSRVMPEHRITGFTPQAQARLLLHTWPGNVRELRNVVDRAVLLETSDVITGESIVFDGEAPHAHALSDEAANDCSLATAEKKLILRVLESTGGHRARSAALLGISRATLCAKLKQYAETMVQACVA
jgi:two-component system, NtrC family, response regulator HydG